ncbi:ABC transporter permease (plasmid) [Paenibacillus cellulosilyticus]|nr:ABC transporter permease [Paenibacillus cellulosilyticus]QKS47780.1 ABC transporter permease [Paenibacillus cellulosilyticus]
MKSTLNKMIAVMSLIGLWYTLVTLNVMWPFQFGNLPGPDTVFRVWFKLLGDLSYYDNITVSSIRVLAGIMIGLVTAVPLGLIIGLSAKTSDIVFTNLEIFRPIPLIAYLPVAMLLFKTIEASIVFITFTGAFFPILINVVQATKRVPVQLVQTAYNLGCKPHKLILRVYLPAIGPDIFTGLSVGTGASWMGVITGEMMSGQTGIGYSTWQAYQLLDYSQSMIGMFSIGLLGFVFTRCVRFTEKIAIRWL